jgi:hypothetical protein
MSIRRKQNYNLMFKEAFCMKETLRKFSLPDVQIPEIVPIAMQNFTQYFKGFEKVDAIREIFGEDTSRVLSELKVEFFSSKFGYMGVSDEDGHLIVSAYYLKTGDPTSKYLDIVHELVHVKQYREGKPLFDEAFEYHDRPTELEAYRHAVNEARRLGMSDPEIFEYLRVNWMSEDEVRRLARNIGVKPPPRRGNGERVR